MVDTWQALLTRLFILAIGVVVGLNNFGTIVYMGFFSGNIIMDNAQYLMLFVGSLLMLIGGIVGAGLKRPVALLPGTIAIPIAWKSIYTLLLLMVVTAVLLLFNCFYLHQQKKQEEMHRINTDGLYSTLDVGYEAEEMRPFKDEKDLVIAKP